MKKLLIFVFGFFMIPSAAYALSFDFTGASAVSQASWSFEEAGVWVTASAWAGGVARNVHRDSFGLGVSFSGDKALEGPSQQIDGRGQVETLSLVFSEPVTLKEAVLSYWEANDEMLLLVDGEADRMSGRVFDFSAPGQDDDYKLQSIEVERLTQDDIPSAGVPEIGTIWLIGVGLVGLSRRCRLSSTSSTS